MTIEAIDEQGKKLATGRFGTATRDYKAMLGYVRQHHIWSVDRVQALVADQQEPMTILLR